MKADLYHPPVDPADPAAAALEVVVRLPELLNEDHRPALADLQALATLLDVAGVFAGLDWLDARTVAALIVCDAIVNSDGAAAALQYRARNAATGADTQPWSNKTSAAQALWIAAEVLR